MRGARQVYSELVGNIMVDAASARKYWHLIRLMGRAASHITLEAALQTHPQAAVISEEVGARDRAALCPRRAPLACLPA